MAKVAQLRKIGEKNFQLSKNMLMGFHEVWILS